MKGLFYCKFMFSRDTRFKSSQGVTVTLTLLYPHSNILGEYVLCDTTKLKSKVSLTAFTHHILISIYPSILYSFHPFTKLPVWDKGDVGAYPHAVGTY